MINQLKEVEDGMYNWEESEWPMYSDMTDVEDTLPMESKGKQKREFDRDKKDRQQQRGKARAHKRASWD